MAKDSGAEQLLGALEPRSKSELAVVGAMMGASQRGNFMKMNFQNRPFGKVQTSESWPTAAIPMENLYCSCMRVGNRRLQRWGCTIAHGPVSLTWGRAHSPLLCSRLQPGRAPRIPAATRGPTGRPAAGGRGRAKAREPGRGGVAAL